MKLFWILACLMMPIHGFSQTISDIAPESESNQLDIATFKEARRAIRLHTLIPFAVGGSIMYWSTAYPDISPSLWRTLIVSGGYLLSGYGLIVGPSTGAFQQKLIFRAIIGMGARFAGLSLIYQGGRNKSAGVILFIGSILYNYIALIDPTDERRPIFGHTNLMTPTINIRF